MSLFKRIFDNAILVKIAGLFTCGTIGQRSFDAPAACLGCDAPADTDYYDYDVDSYLV